MSVWAEEHREAEDTARGPVWPAQRAGVAWQEAGAGGL